MLFTFESIRTTYRKKTEELVGKPFTLKERQQLDGITSPLFTITEVSLQIYNLLVVSQEPQYCRMELRTQGILIHLGKAADKYTLPIPFFKMVVYKGKSEEYSIYKNAYFVKFRADKEKAEIHKFVKKIMDLKSSQNSTFIDDFY